VPRRHLRRRAMSWWQLRDLHDGERLRAELHCVRRRYTEVQSGGWLRWGLHQQCAVQLGNPRLRHRTWAVRGLYVEHSVSLGDHMQHRQRRLRRVYLQCRLSRGDLLRYGERHLHGLRARGAVLHGFRKRGQPRRHERPSPWRNRRWSGCVHRLRYRRPRRITKRPGSAGSRHRLGVEGAPTPPSIGGAATNVTETASYR
jgi:hypothetical protein